MSIPASRIAKINPGVLSAGGNSLVMNGLFLTQSLAMPTSTVLNFASLKAVSNFFGPASAETAAAAIYFAGYKNSQLKPGGMLFAAYNAAARAAFLLGGSLAGMTLPQIQALDGALTITVDGTVETSDDISLAGATSFSNAAALIQAGFTSPNFTVSWNALANAFAITSTATGANATLSFASGTLAPGLRLEAQGGGFLSQGAVADTPATAMQNAINRSQNFATVVTLFEPTLSDKTKFAQWFTAQDDQFLMPIWDSDANASVAGNETCFGYLAQQAAYNGIALISGDPVFAVSQGTTLGALAMNVAIFLAGAIASVNRGATNGRRNAAFLSQAGLTATVDDDQVSQNLIANGYNFYGAYATANQNFTFFYPGQMPGDYDWIDSYVNQIYLNSQMQLALTTLVTEIGDVPYDAFGFGLIRNVLTEPIDAALNFGTIRTGVTLSADQISELNVAAGADAASLVQTQGYYLQILDPGPAVRLQRGSPIVNLWYADGQSVQTLNMGSYDVQ